MGTTTDKINAILNTKENMKYKFNEKGVAVDDSVPFSEYPNKMDELSGGDSFAVNANAVKLNPTHRYATADSSIAIGMINTSVMGVLQNDNE